MMLKEVRQVLIVTGLALLAGCQSTDERPDETLCQEPRPQVCTAIYAPVCARDAAGDERTYASGCNACGNPDVIAHRTGECP